MTMAPLQVILLLLLIRMPAILAQMSPGAAPVQVSGFMAAFVVISYLATLGALVVFVWQRTAKAVRLLNLPSTNGAEVSHQVDRLMSWTRWAINAVVAVHLYLLHLPAVVSSWLSHTVLLGRIPFFAEALYLLPVFLAWLGLWTANYEVESINRERSFPYRLAQGLPAHPMPTLSQYLSMQVRHNYYFVVLIGLVTLFEFLGDQTEGRIPNSQYVFGALAFLSMVLVVPWLMTRIWVTVPLRGPLRQRLDAIAKQNHVRFRNILLWKTHNQVTNAAILGPVHFARYFLMTDALLEQLSDQQIEAVFAHEVGHGVHRHILWYFAGLIGALSLTGGVAKFMQVYATPAINLALVKYVGTPDAAAYLFVMVAMGLVMSFGFPLVSHRFEHQADWFAARHMSKMFAARNESLPMPAIALTQAPDPVEYSASIVDLQPLPVQNVTVEQYAAGEYPHARPSDVPPPKVIKPSGPNILNARPIQTVLSPEIAGTEVFISALDALVEITHRSRDKRGWMHPSINNRAMLLRELARNPAAAAAFRHRMIRTRIIIAAVLVVGAATALMADRLPDPPAQEQPQQQLPVSKDGKVFQA